MDGPDRTRDRGLVAAFAVYAVLALAWVASASSLTQALEQALGISATAADTVATLSFLVVTGVALFVLLARWRGSRAREDASLRGLLDGAPQGIYRFRLRPEPRFEYLNQALVDMTGFTADEFHADPDLALRRVHPDDRILVHRLRSEPGEVAGGVEVRWHHRDGRWLWHWVREVAATDASGRATIVHGSVTDVTEFKQQNAGLRAELEGRQDALDAMHQVTELRDAFIRSLSHELRTPLTGILGFTRMLHGHDGDLEPVVRADVLDRLVRSAERLQQLIDDLLDLDQVTASETHALRRPIDVASSIKTVLDAVQGPNVVEADLTPGIALVDPRKLERIVTHLLHNAGRHTPPGTPVRIRSHFEADTLVIVVEDEGPGVPDELKGAVLAPFIQGSGARAQPSPGVGIGLAVADRFARLHGGEVVVSDREGGGARFVVRLPDADPLA